MANVAIVTTNLADACQGTVSSAVAGMGVDLMLGSPHVHDDKWRSATAGYGWMQLDAGGDLSFDTIALYGLNLTAAATVRLRIGADGGSAGDVYDETFDSGDAQFDPNYGFVLALPAPVSGRYLLADLADASLPYVEIGKPVFGLRESLAYNFLPGASLGWVDPSIAERARGGQTQIWRRRKYRTATVSLGWVSEAQRWGVIEAIGRDNGTTRNVLLLLDPEADNLPQMTLWGRATALTPPAWTQIADIFATSLTVEERL